MTACECSGHGSCEVTTGACKCYTDRTRGYWDGLRCDTCLPGIIGKVCSLFPFTSSTHTSLQTCQQRESSPTRLEFDGHTSARTDSIAAYFIVKDAEQKKLYVGYDKGLAEYALPSFPPQFVDEKQGISAHAMWFGKSTAFVLVQGAANFEVHSFDRAGTVQALAHVTDTAVSSGTPVSACNVGDTAVVVSRTCEVFTGSGASLDPLLQLTLSECHHVSCAGQLAVVCSPVSCAAVDLPGAVEGPPIFTADTSAAVKGVSATEMFSVALTSGTNTMLHQVGYKQQPQETYLADSTGQSTAAVGVANDGLKSVGYVYRQKDAHSPSVLSKVLVQPGGGWYGKAQMKQLLTPQGKVVSEVLTTLLVDDEYRVLWGSGAYGMGLVAFSLHEVADVEPPLADERGGTELAVVGRGYGDIASTCYFEEGMASVTATFLNTTTMGCVADAVALPLCEGAGVIVKHETRDSDGVASLLRYAPPQLTSVMPSRAASWKQNLITIRGSGFKRSSFATCVFHSWDSGTVRLYRGRSVGTQLAVYVPCDVQCAMTTYGYVSAVHVPATVLNSTAVECVQPEIKAAPLNLSLVDVALDGQIYTDAPLALPILREAGGISSPATHTVSEDKDVPLYVHVRDSSGGKLLELDTEKRPGYACVVQGGSCLIQFNFTTANGVFLCPSVHDWPIISGDRREFVVRFTLSNGWTSSTNVVLVHGAPFRLRFIQAPPVTVAAEELLFPVVIEVLDSSLYRVTSLDNALMRASILPENTTDSVDVGYTSTRAGVATFNDMKLSLLVGTAYTLVFTLTEYPDVPDLVSDIIEAANCPVDKYQEVGLSGCYTCPKEGAICNGTATLETVPGYWSPGGNTFFRCRSDDVCLGSQMSAATQCLEGSDGALCQGCSNGYARARSVDKPCEECEGTKSYAIAILLALAYLVFGFVVILVTARSYQHKGTLGEATVLLRNTIVFLQVLGKFNEYSVAVPDPLETSFFLFGRISLFDFSLFQQFNCLARSYFPLLEIYLLFPLTSVVLAAFAYIPGKYCLFGKMTREEIAGTAHRRITMRFLAGVSLTVSFFLCYPTMLTHFLAYQKCKTYPDGSGGTMKRLWVDVTIDCDDAEYERRHAVASAASYVIGVFLPFLFLVSYTTLRRMGRSDWLVYFVGGYKEEMWFFPVLVLAREAAVVAPALFASEHQDKTIQLYAAVWSSEIALFLHYYFQPYVLRRHNFLETVSLSVTTIAFNLCLLYPVNGISPTQRALLTNFVNLLCWVTLLVFLYFFLPAGMRGAIQDKIEPLAQKLGKKRKREDPVPSPPTWHEKPRLVTHIEPSEATERGESETGTGNDFVSLLPPPRRVRPPSTSPLLSHRTGSADSELVPSPSGFMSPPDSPHAQRPRASTGLATMNPTRSARSIRKESIMRGPTYAALMPPTSPGEPLH